MAIVNPGFQEDEPGFWEASAITTMATRGASSATGGTDRVPWLVATVAETIAETVAAVTLRLEVPDWRGHRPGEHVDVRLTAEDGYCAQGTLRTQALLWDQRGVPAFLLDRSRLEAAHGILDRQKLLPARTAQPPAATAASTATAGCCAATAPDA